jgi:hypothetical protein
MTDLNLPMHKDLGLQREVMDALPYAVVGGTWEGSLEHSLHLNVDYKTLLNHVVPAGQQLKLLFLRIWTQDAGAIFSIVQSNPAAAGLTDPIEAFPVVGSVPPYVAGATAVRDYPMLEAAGAEVLRGSLMDPVHVLEGSIDFRLQGPTPALPTGNKYSLTWWGVEKLFE